MTEYTYRHPRPMVTVDTVLIVREPLLRKVLLICRGQDPFSGKWALPGGFLEMGEDLEDGARRELEEETGLQVDTLIQIGAFGAPERDPRGRTISVVFAGVTDTIVNPQGGDDAREAALFPIDDLPPLAFDHDRILTAAVETLRKIELLP